MAPRSSKSRILFLSLLLSTMVLNAAAAITRPSDVAALLSIKSAIGAKDNGAFSTWQPNQDPCTGAWQHVICAQTVVVTVSQDTTSTFAVVTSLDLTGLKIAAPFPSAVTSLVNLVTLKLGGNQFTGDLTLFDFSALQILQSLTLNDNALSGTVPKSLAALANTLTEVNVANNNFNGVASELKALKKLKVLSLSNNPLGTTIPSWLDGTFTALTDLEMSFCKLYGGVPDSVTQIPNLLSLLLDNNNLGNGALCATPTTADLTTYPGHGGESWCINPKLKNLQNLVQLDLSTNGWTGNIPPQLGSLTNLQTLRIWDNQLEGSIPTELSRLLNLKTLNLNNNGLTGSIPVAITTMPALSTFWVQTNQLTGPIPSEIGNMNSLTDVELQLNQLSGPIPQSLANLGPKMTKLQLQNNLFWGPIPDFSRFTNIVRLDLNKNFLGALDAFGNVNQTAPIGIPASLGNLTTLEYLDLSNNLLGGALPPQLGKLVNLNYLDLSSNRFTGALPDSLAKLTKLQHMFLEVNGFSGAIPDWFKNMTSLQDLYLYENEFSGALPASIFQAPALASLTVHSNKLSGSLPVNCNGSTTLGQVDLSDNAFTGSFPVCLTTLNLTFLNLENNQLSGPLPEQLGNMSSIQLLGLGYNAFSGSVPSTLCNILDTLQAIDISNNQLEGNISSCLIDFATQNPDTFNFWYDGNSFTCDNLDACPDSPSGGSNPFSPDNTFGKSPPPMPNTPPAPPAPPTRSPPPPGPKSGANRGFPALMQQALLVVVGGLFAFLL